MFDNLTRADVQKIRQALAKADEGERKAMILEACGVPCDELKDRCIVQKEFCTKWLSEFANLAPERK